MNETNITIINIFYDKLIEIILNQSRISCNKSMMLYIM